MTCKTFKLFIIKIWIRINGVMISMLASSVIDRGFDSRATTKMNEIGICCFSAKHAALRRRIKYWLDAYQDNVSEWRVNLYRVSVSYHYKNPFKQLGPVQSGHYHHYLLICNWSLHDIAENSSISVKDPSITRLLIWMLYLIFPKSDKSYLSFYDGPSCYYQSIKSLFCNI